MILLAKKESVASASFRGNNNTSATAGRIMSCGEQNQRYQRLFIYNIYIYDKYMTDILNLKRNKPV